ncbi:MAG: adenine deaminase [Bacillales bacterium]|nr:adenine deaminase [Bacillales bacterium]
MINKFNKAPLWEVSKDLASVAMGRKNAEIVIKNAKIINVCTREILEGRDVAIIKGRIAKLGKCDDVIGEDTKVIDASNMYLAPAFMDGHIHIESSMLTPKEYAKAVIPHGTSAIFMDPHEVCNVLGLKAVRCMLDDAKGTPLKVMLATPSCVPAIPGFEDTGSYIGPSDVKETMTWDECIGLGEMMNFPGIINSNEETHAIVGETLKAGKIVTGHYSIPETENGLNAYISSGVRCCHESTRAIDALEKMRLGMYAQLREGSAWHDLQEVKKAITDHEVDSRFACLVTDDTHPNTLIEKGHLDYVVKRAIEEGINPIEAIQMVTINVAQLFQLDHDMGSITPSKCADMVLIDDLNACHVVMTFINGELVAENGKNVVPFEEYVYPSWATDSLNLKDLTIDDFALKSDKDQVKAHVIEVIPGKTITLDKIMDFKVVDNKVVLDGNDDVLKAVVFDRHHKNGKYSFGFVKGFGIKGGALAQTVAHDAHNMLIIGSNDEDMLLAYNTLRECKGGSVAIKNGKVIGKVELPLAGLMSLKSLEDTKVMVDSLENAWKEMGSTLPSPFMTMGILSLACIPTLRLTNRGLVDCNKFEFVDLFINK